MKSARGAVLSSCLVAPPVEKPGAAGSSGALSAAAGLNAGKSHGSKAAAAASSGHCSAGGTGKAGRQTSAAEPAPAGPRGDVQQAPGGLQGHEPYAAW